jgi:hypothetical protein
MIPIRTCPAYRSRRTQFGRIFQLRIATEIIAAAFYCARRSSAAFDGWLLRFAVL